MSKTEEFWEQEHAYWTKLANEEAANGNRYEEHAYRTAAHAIRMARDKWGSVEPPAMPPPLSPRQVAEQLERMAATYSLDASAVEDEKILRAAAVLLRQQGATTCECTDRTPDVKGCHCRACGKAIR